MAKYRAQLPDLSDLNLNKKEFLMRLPQKLQESIVPADAAVPSSFCWYDLSFKFADIDAIPVSGIIFSYAAT